MTNPKSKKENFVQEYLYIEDYVPYNVEAQEQEKDDNDRGVIVIDIFDTSSEVTLL